jgi:thiosulfate reductase cytochrome b subunit
VTADGEPPRRGLPRVQGEDQPSAASPSPSGPADATPVSATSAVRRSPGLMSGRAETMGYGRYTRRQWIGGSVALGLAIIIVATLAVFLARWLLPIEPLRDFVVTYPGQYRLPANAPVGDPGWLGWQHFLNAFLIVLIIRSGLQVRRQKKPPALWSPRWNPQRRISINLWFHQALDLLWLVNGVIFVVLLVTTGQWMKVVPTSWAVFPNAASAALQYVSLNWPTENGWVNYNSLQQLAYFTTIFIAAPLAALTGFRMSGLWPTRSPTLSRLCPLRWARAIHFPVMIYFVAFTAVHVILVLATGALRNLNHIYAAQGSVNPYAYSENWTGFVLFVLSLAIIAAGWIAARPVLLAPVARLFGTVSRR